MKNVKKTAKTASAVAVFGAAALLLAPGSVFADEAPAADNATQPATTTVAATQPAAVTAGLGVTQADSQTQVTVDQAQASVDAAKADSAAADKAAADELNKELDQAKADVDAAQKEVDNAASDVTDAEDAKAEAQKKADEAVGVDVEKTQQNVDDAQAAVDKAQGELDKASQAVSDAAAEYAKGDAELDKANEDYSAAQKASAAAKEDYLLKKRIHLSVWFQCKTHVGDAALVEKMKQAEKALVEAEKAYAQAREAENAAAATLAKVAANVQGKSEALDRAITARVEAQEAYDQANTALKDARDTLDGAVKNNESYFDAVKEVKYWEDILENELRPAYEQAVLKLEAAQTAYSMLKSIDLDAAIEAGSSDLAGDVLNALISKAHAKRADLATAEATLAKTQKAAKTSMRADVARAVNAAIPATGDTAFAAAGVAAAAGLSMVGVAEILRRRRERGEL